MTAKKKKLVGFFGLVLFLVVAGSLHLPFSGTVIDKNTGLPLEGAVLVRTWTRALNLLPGGPTHTPVGFDEELTDENGSFHFSTILFLQIYVPRFLEIEEEGLVVYKPGYQFLHLRDRGPVIELEPLPATHAMREKEVELAAGYWAVHAYPTWYFKEFTELEKSIAGDLSGREWSAGDDHRPKWRGSLVRGKTFVQTTEARLHRIAVQPGGPLSPTVTPPVASAPIPAVATNDQDLSGSESVEILLAALDDPDRARRKKAIIALGQRKDDRTVEALLMVLSNDPEPVMQAAAAEALGRIADPRAIEALLSVIRTTQDSPGLPVLSLSPRQAATEALAKIGQPAVGRLIQALRDEHRYIRAAAVYALGEIKDGAALEGLCRALQDQDQLVRHKAVEALRTMRDVRAAGALLDVVRQGQDPLLPTLAADALESLGTPAAEVLVQALRDRNMVVREQAAELLVAIGAPVVGSVAEVLAEKDILARMVAAWVLETIGRSSVDALTVLLRHNNRDIRRRIAAILGDVADPRATDSLMAVLEQDADLLVRCRAAEALGKIRDRKALESLDRASREAAEPVRKAATWAVKQL